jgi:hypothetical protein
MVKEAPTASQEFETGEESDQRVINTEANVKYRISSVTSQGYAYSTTRSEMVRFQHSTGFDTYAEALALAQSWGAADRDWMITKGNEICNEENTSDHDRTNLSSEYDGD